MVHPDYQGIGIGTRLCLAVMKKASDMGFTVSITTAAKNIIHSFKNNPNLKCTGLVHRSYSNKSRIEKTKKIKRDCATVSFLYKRR